MISHMTLAVKDFENSREFYDKTLASLGYERCMDIEDESHLSAGYGKNGMPVFFIVEKKILSDLDKQEDIGKARGLHVCFAAPSHEAVKNWHSLSCKCGGKDNGMPGPRADYPPKTTAAYIVDPDGWRLEACCFEL